MRSWIVVACLLPAALAAADPDLKTFGVDATVVVPLSPWRDRVGTGGGGTLWVHVPVGPYVEVTARLGAIVHSEQTLAADAGERARLSEIPLIGGARFRLTDGAVRAYVEGEVGLVFARVDAQAAGVTDNSSAINFGCQLGAALEVGRFDLRVAVWFADLSDPDHNVGVIGSVGVRALSF